MTQLQVSLREAALIEESYAAGHGACTDDVSTLLAEGLELTVGVSLTDVMALDRNTYCIEGTHAELPADDEWKVAHFTGRPAPLGKAPARAAATMTTATTTGMATMGTMTTIATATATEARMRMATARKTERPDGPCLEPPGGS